MYRVRVLVASHIVTLPLIRIVLVFIDKNTPRPFVEDLSVYGDDGGVNEIAALKDHVYLDAMGLGMGCCCLQVTFQAQSIDEARFLYDQLTPLTPIMVRCPPLPTRYLLHSNSS